MRQVEDQNTDQHAKDSAENVRAAENPEIKCIEAIPDAAPNEDETQGDSHIAR